MPYRNRIKQRVVMECFSMLAVLALITAPISLASGGRDSNTNLHAGMEISQ